MWAWFSIYTSYSYIDASTDEYQEEDAYSQEEEENFDNYSAQGKLTLAKHKCLALQEQRHHHLLPYVLPIPGFYLHLPLLIYFKVPFWFMIHLV
jgi:hypothetical protein